MDLFSHINLKRVDQARGRHGRKIPKGQEAIRTLGDEEEEARRCERLGRNTTLSAGLCRNSVVLSLNGMRSMSNGIGSA